MVTVSTPVPPPITGGDHLKTGTPPQSTQPLVTMATQISEHVHLRVNLA